MTDEYPSLCGGRYIITKCIGSGGMGAVFRCYDQRLKVDRAVKILRPELVSRSDTRQRFTREAVAMAKLSHPNIVQVFDYGQEALTLFIIMEYLPYDSVQGYLNKVGPLSDGQAVKICLQAAQGLLYMHEKGQVHRDIKPANLLLTDKTVKVSDFGLVKADIDELNTQSNAIMGTFAFMSPEQRLGTKTIGHQTDIYALTATLYMCLTCKTPIDLYQSSERERVFVDLNPHLTQIMERGLEADQKERYSSIDDLITDLQSFLEVTTDTEPFLLSEVDLDTEPQSSIELNKLWAEYTSQPSYNASFLDDTIAPNSQDHNHNLESTIAPAEPQHSDPLDQSLSESISEVEVDQFAPTLPQNTAKPISMIKSMSSLLILIMFLFLMSRLFWADEKATVLNSAEESTKSSYALLNMDTAQKSEQVLFKTAQTSMLQGDYALADQQFGQLAKTQGNHPYLNILRRLNSYIRWNAYQGLSTLFLQSSYLDLNEKPKPYMIMLNAIKMSADSSIGSEALEQRWAELRQTYPGPISALLYLVMTKHIWPDLYSLKLNKLREEYPHIYVFKDLEIKVLKDQKSDQVMELIETLLKEDSEVSSIALTYAAEKEEIGQLEAAESTLKSLLSKSNLKIETHIILARIYAKRFQEAKRIEQMIMALSDQVAVRDQVVFLSLHGEDLVRLGQVNEAMKVWQFCQSVENPNQDQLLTVTQADCLIKKLQTASWFEQTTLIRSTIKEIKETLIGLQGHKEIQQLLTLMTMEAEAKLALIQDQDHGRYQQILTQLKHLQQRPLSASLHQSMITRLALFTLIHQGEDSEIIDALKNRSHQPVEKRSCDALYQDILLMNHLSKPKLEEKESLLRSIIKGQCIQESTYILLMRSAQVMWARLLFNEGKRIESFKLVQAVLETWKNGDPNLALMKEARQIYTKF
jgi:serine/threonine protein kinase